MFFENDDDYVMAELTRQGNIARYLKTKGICLHGRRQGAPGGNMEPDEAATCLDCGKVSTEGELDAEASNYL